MSIFGIPVIESSALPLHPSPGEVGRRIVRHGLADVLEWLGEDVGPEPEALTHMLMIGNTIHASAAMVGTLREQAPTGYGCEVCA